MVYVKAFFLVYFIVIALIFGLSRGYGSTKLLPGDVYIQKAGRVIYIPIGSSLLLTIIIFVILIRLVS
jgi:hypothetical protein